MHRIMDTKLFYILNYTDIEYQLETILDGISKRTVIRTLSYYNTIFYLKHTFHRPKDVRLTLLVSIPDTLVEY